MHSNAKLPLTKIVAAQGQECALHTPCLLLNPIGVLQTVQFVLLRRQSPFNISLTVFARLLHHGGHSTSRAVVLEDNTMLLICERKTTNLEKTYSIAFYSNKRLHCPK
jgi:hypothetical protein